MLKRTRSQTQHEGPRKPYRSPHRADHSDESDCEFKENLPSPPSTPQKRLRASPDPPTPKNVRHITKELQSTKVTAPLAASTNSQKNEIAHAIKKKDSKSTAAAVAATPTAAVAAAACKSETIYQKAKAAFRRSAAPSRLVGRIKERERMTKFWAEHVVANKPGCLYVSGSPGTGKTAMLNEIIQHFSGHTYTHQVRQVVVNCMSIREPKGIYTKLVTELKPPRVSFQDDLVKQAGEIINAKSDILTVVILDEVDQLATKDQDVLYKIFEWATSPSSRLVLIGIANAIDMTDRLLPRLRAKNCEPQLLNFNPYQPAEISAIIKDRLYALTPHGKHDGPLPLMQPPAIELCAKKVAAAMGDLRTALDICCRAIELAELEYKRKNTQTRVLGEQKQNGATSVPNEADVVKVTILHVMKVHSIVFGNPVVHKLKQLGLQQKIVMGVLMVMSRSSSVGSKKEHITLGRFRDQYVELCGKINEMIKPVSRTELSDLLTIIETAGLITIGKQKEEQLRRITLNAPESDIMQMINEKIVLKSWIETVSPK